MKKKIADTQKIADTLRAKSDQLEKTKREKAEREKREKEELASKLQSTSKERMKNHLNLCVSHLTETMIRKRTAKFTLSTEKFVAAVEWDNPAISHDANVFHDLLMEEGFEILERTVEEKIENGTHRINHSFIVSWEIKQGEARDESASEAHNERS